MVPNEPNKPSMTRYHDSQRFISNVNNTLPDPARDIPISRAVRLDSPVRFLQRLWSYVSLCLLQRRFGGHNVLVSPRPAASLRIVNFFPP